MTRTAGEGDERGYMTVKVKKVTYRLFKTVASWRGLTVQDYLDDLAKRESVPDLRKILGEMTDAIDQADENGAALGTPEQMSRSKKSGPKSKGD